MGFHNIPPIEQADEHLDIAFRRAKQAADRVKNRLKKRGLNIQRIREIERTRFNTATDALTHRIQKIHNTFPDLRNATPFLQELMSITLDKDRFKKALASMSWFIIETRKLQKAAIQKINKTEQKESLHAQRKAFYGRLSSFCKQLNPHLKYLDSVRYIIRDYPILKELPTIAIAGFPNVGKTTLLAKLTTSKPKIAAYAFTTKQINVGYATINGKSLQILDTPGTLARPQRMNPIEKQAYCAIKHCADRIIFVIDPTETYPLEKQERLLDLITKTRKSPTSAKIVYMSKKDIATKEQMEKIKKRHPQILTSLQEMKKQLA
jgi:nucleolar GTP-binding protein